MNYIDILIAAPFLYAIIKGFLNGVIKEITGFFSFFVSIDILMLRALKLSLLDNDTLFNFLKISLIRIIPW